MSSLYFLYYHETIDSFRFHFPLVLSKHLFILVGVFFFWVNVGFIHTSTVYFSILYTSLRKFLPYLFAFKHVYAQKLQDTLTSYNWRLTTSILDF